MRALSSICLCLLLWTLSSTSFGHPRIDEARRRFEEADFNGALEVLDDAENATDLSRTDVIEIIELRAIVHNALGSQEETDASLRALASLEPEHRFPPEAPPELVEQFSSIEAQPLALRVNRREAPLGAVIEATVLHDPTGLVQQIIIMARPESGGEWQRSIDEALLFELSEGQSEEWHVAAVGPGNAILVSEASRERMVQPVTFGEETVQEEAPDPFAEPEEQDQNGGRRGRWPLWVGVGVGTATAVILAIVIGVVVGGDQSDQDTEVSGPFMPDF